MSERHLTRIGKYEVECVIGEGSMGVVYRAMDPLINRRVAIKVMADAVAQDAGLRDRFLREAQAAGSLQHPNVVTIYDFGEVDDHLFIAMEYVEGNDLADLIAKKVTIRPSDALDLIIGLLHGLAYAHKRGIIHRDIKPANVRVDGEGKARLMDFGVAHLASSELTSTGMLLGTPAYMAPEQITGGAVTAETDLFSVGAVLYELLAGRRPFVGETLQSLMYSILNKSPEPLENYVSKLPPGLNDVVMRALAKEPSHRYHSALAMANDLSAILNALEPEGKRTSLSLRAAIDTALAQEHKARKRRKVGGQAAIFVAGAVLAAVLFGAARFFLMHRDSGAQREAPVTVGGAAGTAPAVRDTSRAVPAPAAPVVPAPAAPVASRSNELAERAPRPTISRPAVDTKSGADRLTSAPKSIAVDSKPVDSAASLPAPPVPHVSTAVERTPAVTQSSAAVPAAVAPPPTAAPAPRENVAEQVNAAIAAYARALESLDVAQLRRAYPAISADQRKAFEDFFRSIRTLNASLTVGNLQIDGASAEAQVTGAFDYVTSNGSTERRPVSFVATFRRDRSNWILAAIH
ncbi:MAG TPA: serine/threonine-protein kinase [Gemmatimonadaceae bacterium]|nr:serine/threonine-protein kinase [Gemmatimonadaceae bacterium]